MKHRIQRKWSKATLQAFKMLQSQDFEDFYKGEMDDFILGEEAAKSPDEICSKIASMMGEPQAPKIAKENRTLELAGVMLTESRLDEGQASDCNRIFQEVMGGLNSKTNLLGKDMVVVKAGITDAYEAGYDAGEAESQR